MTKKTLRSFFSVCSLFAMFFTSCSAGMFETLNRTSRDPFFEIPSVFSLEERYVIHVTWKEDEAADEYLLYRAKDDLNPVYTLIYRGNEVGYRDVFSIGNSLEKYLYRLMKRRGNSVFGDLTTRGKAALGFVSEVEKDTYEPNDILADAIPLSYTVLDINSHYFESNAYDGIAIYDQDWFYVDIPAKCNANVLVIDNIAPLNAQNEHFDIVLEEKVLDNYHAGISFEIANKLNIPKRYYFMVKPKVSVFRIDSNSIDPTTGGCGQFVPYSIKVVSIESI
jgi:hypothetical protein